MPEVYYAWNDTLGGSPEYSNSDFQSLGQQIVAQPLTTTPPAGNHGDDEATFGLTQFVHLSPDGSTLVGLWFVWDTLARAKAKEA